MSDRVISIIFFVLIIALTLGITAWASRQNKSTSDHYVAGGAIKGWQNGLAISGDYLSAASFLGIAGAISLTGFSGFYLSIGFLVAYLVVLLLVAEPLRNLGKYTFADMLASRFNKSSVRSAAALSTIAISMFYMIAQLNGAGALIELLLGINYVALGHRHRHPDDGLHRGRRHGGDDLDPDSQGRPPHRRHPDPIPLGARPAQHRLQPGQPLQRGRTRR